MGRVTISILDTNDLSKFLAILRNQVLSKLESRIGSESFTFLPTLELLVGQCPTEEPALFGMAPLVAKPKGNMK